MAQERLIKISNHLLAPPLENEPNLQIIKERNSLDPQLVRQITNVIYDGEANVRQLEECFLLIKRDPYLFIQRPYDMDILEARKVCMRQIKRYIEIIRERIEDTNYRGTLLRALSLYDRSISMRIGVHELLFRYTIRGQGTDQQIEKWDKLAERFDIIGCFAMTELGTSSSLSSIETIAVYDRENGQFVIHSPSLTSTKWWIGMAGQTATHTVALCKLIIEGEEKGLYWFIIPLRNKKGEIKVGVNVGDIGPKAGRNGLDNGWIQFSSVRIAKENLLGRWIKWTEKDEFIPADNAAISYATLIGERVTLTNCVFDDISAAITITLRYSVVRKQGPLFILDYQPHYYRLLPILSSLYAVLFTSKKLQKEYEELLLILAKGKEKEFLKGVNEIHSIAAGLKCWCGWWASDSLETFRRCMGGHGYSSYSSIPSLIDDWGVLTQGGGPNEVVAQQLSRWLLSNYQKAISGDKIPSRLNYFLKRNSFLSSKPSFDFSSFSPSLLFSVLETLSVILLEENSLEIKRMIGEGINDFWNKLTMRLIDCSRVHSYYEILTAFSEFLSSPHNLPPQLCEIFSDLFKLSSISFLLSISDLLVEFLNISPAQITFLKKELTDLSFNLRKFAIPLTDAFNLPDFILKSSFGRYDGNVYENYFSDVISNPNFNAKTPYWDELVAPLFSDSQY